MLMLQILNAADLADIGFKPEWNSDPQLMGIYFMLLIISVRPSTPFSADTDTPIFCCQSNTIPIF